MIKTELYSECCGATTESINDKYKCTHCDKECATSGKGYLLSSCSTLYISKSENYISQGLEIIYLSNEELKNLFIALRQYFEGDKNERNTVL